MARTSTRSRRSKGTVVDFTGVEAGGIPVPDGKYLVEVATVTQEESEAGNDYLAWKFKVTDPDGPNGAVVYDNTSLLPQALWKLKGLLISLGEEVPDGEMELDPAAYIGNELVIEVVNESWEGRDRPRVVGYQSLDEKEEEPPQKTTGRRGRKAAEEKEEPAPTRSRRPAEQKEEEEEKPTTGRTRRSRKPSGPKVGDQVEFDDEGDTIEGEITKIDGDNVTVVTEDGDEWEVGLDEVKVITD